MNKVYLLLRNNQQTGPYSLEELTALPLQPFDLIWVEGKSFGWSYPGEIETLKPYVVQAAGASPAEQLPQAPSPASSQTAPASKKIFVSLPQKAAARPAPQPQQSRQQPIQPQAEPQAATPDTLEQKAEELRKRIQAQAAQSSTAPEETQTRYSRSINDVEEDYTDWVIRQKTKKKKAPVVQWAAAVAVLGFAGYLGWTMMSDEKETAQPRAIIQPVSGQSSTEPEQSIIEESEVLPASDSRLPLAENKKKKETARMQQQEKKEVSTVSPTQEPHTASTHPAVQETSTPPSVAEPQANNKAEEEATASAEPKREKKKLGKAINNALEKLKGNKGEENGEEAPRSVTSKSGERKAARRGEDNSAASEAPDLSAQVKLVASERPADWMMGVVGQKLTLYNLSNQTIKTAIVEVIYYNEQDKLLEKKQIQFTNIGPSRTKTLPIPDHRLADHASYKVVSASGNAEAFARR